MDFYLLTFVKIKRHNDTIELYTVSHYYSTVGNTGLFTIFILVSVIDDI